MAVNASMACHPCNPQARPGIMFIPSDKLKTWSRSKRTTAPAAILAPFERHKPFGVDVIGVIGRSNINSECWPRGTKLPLCRDGLNCHSQVVRMLQARCGRSGKQQHEKNLPKLGAKHYPNPTSNSSALFTALRSDKEGFNPLEFSRVPFLISSWETGKAGTYWAQN